MSNKESLKFIFQKYICNWSKYSYWSGACKVNPDPILLIRDLKPNLDS